MKGNFIYKRLGENIARIRRSNSFSQEEVSLVCRIDRTYLGKVEQGKANPSLRVMLKLSRFFKVKLSDLFKGVGVIFIVATIDPLDDLLEFVFDNLS